MSEEMQGYRQQPGKLPFAKPGSGGSEPFSKLRDIGTSIPPQLLLIIVSVKLYI